MPKSKKSKRKHNPQKTIDRILIGLTISWTDIKPTVDSTELIPGEISHTNPMMISRARHIFLNAGRPLVSTEILLWQITITVVAYHAELQKEWRETREMTARCALCDLEEHSVDQTNDAMNYIGTAEYEKTEFECRVLGR